MIKCLRCKTVKEQSDFAPCELKLSSNGRGRPKKKSQCCKSCRTKSHLKLTYNLTHEDYIQMLQGQQGLCAICFKAPKTRLHVDHNHTTGAVRGLLCFQCNAGIGHFQEDLRALNQAIKYLTDFL